MSAECLPGTMFIHSTTGDVLVRLSSGHWFLSGHLGYRFLRDFQVVPAQNLRDWIQVSANFNRINFLFPWAPSARMEDNEPAQEARDALMRSFGENP